MSSFRPCSDDDVTVLLVCTGNICRSALAERLGRAYLTELLGEDAGRIRLVSAGTQAVVGSRMHSNSDLVLQGFGGDATGFRARQLDARTAAEADLVLTMTRAHRQAVLQEAPRAMSRTFTMLEAVDLLGHVRTDGAGPGGDPAARVRALVKELAAARSRRQARDGDDIADPIGRSIEAHQAAADAVAGSLLPLLGRLAELVRAPSADRTRTLDGAVV